MQELTAHVLLNQQQTDEICYQEVAPFWNKSMIEIHLRWTSASILSPLLQRGVKWASLYGRQARSPLPRNAG